jgi:hypothetical protein
MIPGTGRFIAWTALKTALAAAAIFVLAWIAVPDLVNRHNTALLFVAIACALAALAIAVWLALTLRADIARFRRRPSITWEDTK